MKLKTFPYTPVAQLLGAFLFLSVLLNLDYPASQWLSWHLFMPSLDCLFLLIFLATLACWSKRLTSWAVVPICALFLTLRLLRIGDTVVPMYLNRPFNLYIDSGYILGLCDLLKTTAHKNDTVQIAVIAVLVVLGTIISSWYTWRMAATALSNKLVRISVFLISGLILSTVFMKGWQPRETTAIVRFGQELLSIQHQLEQQQVIATHMEDTARSRRTEPATLNGLKGADVLLFMVESYGHIVFNKPQYREAMETTLNHFAKVLDQYGFMAVSSYLESPAYGGSSWLAHSTLEFGLRIKNDLDKTALLRSSLQPLASYFRKNGYHTVSVMPGTRFIYPEGIYFGFEKAYYAWDFNYKGPSFGWAPMSDQFVLDFVRRQEFTRRKQPLFVRYVLISTHAAYNIQPQFIDEWETIGDGSIYAEQQPLHYPVYWPDLTNAGEAYLRSLDYEFTALGDYLSKYVSQESLIIIMGDHQPNLQLTGEGEPWSVPVHIISRNPQLLKPFKKRGYTPGLIPVQPLPHAGMETFFQGFLQDFR